MFRVIISALRKVWVLLAGIAAGCSLFPGTPPRVSEEGGSGVGGGGSAGLGGLGGEAGAAGSGGVAGSDGGCPTQTVTLEATADTYIANVPPNSTHGGEDVLELRAFSPGAGHRALVRFDLSSIPAGVAITHATLELTLVLNEGASHDVGVHRAAQDWTESASWNKYDGQSSWVSGGEFMAVPVDFQVVDGSTQVGTQVGWDVTTDVIDTAPFGWLVKDENDNVLNGERLHFASRESATAADRPKLAVSFESCAD